MGEAAAVGRSEEARDDDSIPLSALQHTYCLRQAALIHLERMWAESRFTAEGQVVHLATHEPGARRRWGVRRVTALPLASRRLRIVGVADLVEFQADVDGENVAFLTRLPLAQGRIETGMADDSQKRLASRSRHRRSFGGKARLGSIGVSIARGSPAQLLRPIYRRRGRPIAVEGSHRAGVAQAAATSSEVDPGLALRRNDAELGQVPSHRQDARSPWTGDRHRQIVESSCRQWHGQRWQDRYGVFHRRPE
jgi:hypothetical protein